MSQEWVPALRWIVVEVDPDDGSRCIADIYEISRRCTRSDYYHMRSLARGGYRHPQYQILTEQLNLPHEWENMTPRQLTIRDARAALETMRDLRQRAEEARQTFREILADHREESPY